MVIFLIFLACLPLISGFFHSGFPFTNDGTATIIRLSEMFRVLKDFQIPPRWSGYLNHGYGYPLFNFVYPLPYFLAILVYFFHFGLVNTMKIIFAMTVPLSGIAMFLAARKLWKNNLAAVVCSLLYLYLPYRLVNLYVRGSIGESISTIFYPLIIWLSPSLPLTALAFGGLIMAHNIAAVYFLPIAGIFFLAQILTGRKRGAFLFALALILGLGIAAFFWLPALMESKFILLSQIPIAQRELYFLKPGDLWIPKWGFGAPVNPDGFGYQFSWPHLVIFLISTFFIFRQKFIFPKLSVILFLILIPFLFSLSDPVWKILPLYKTINYPWTLLGPLGFLASISAGALWQSRFGKITAVIFTFAAIILVINHTSPVSFLKNNNDFYLTNDSTTTSSNELMPLWVKEFPQNRPVQKIEILQGKGTVQIQKEKSQIVNAFLELKTAGIIRTNIIYYPGWKIFVDGKETEINYDNKYGVMDVTIGPGNHFLEAKFKETPLRLAADIISLASLLTTVYLLFRKKSKEGLSPGKGN